MLGGAPLPAPLQRDLMTAMQRVARDAMRETGMGCVWNVAEAAREWLDDHAAAANCTSGGSTVAGAVQDGSQAEASSTSAGAWVER